MNDTPDPNIRALRALRALLTGPSIVLAVYLGLQGVGAYDCSSLGRRVVWHGPSVQCIVDFSSWKLTDTLSAGMMLRGTR